MAAASIIGMPDDLTGGVDAEGYAAAPAKRSEVVGCRINRRIGPSAEAAGGSAVV